MTMRENNHTLYICFILVFLFLYVYCNGIRFKLRLDPAHLFTYTAPLSMGCSNGNSNGNGNRNGNSNHNSDGKDIGTGNSD